MYCLGVVAACSSDSGSYRERVPTKRDYLGVHCSERTTADELLRMVKEDSWIGVQVATRSAGAVAQLIEGSFGPMCYSSLLLAGRGQAAKRIPLRKASGFAAPFTRSSQLN
jgi:hypothetical protein